MDVANIPKKVDYKKVQNFINHIAPKNIKPVDRESVGEPRRVTSARERNHIGSKLDVNG